MEPKETHPAPQELVLELNGIVSPQVALLRLLARLCVNLEGASQTFAREEAVADIEAVVIVGDLISAAVEEGAISSGSAQTAARALTQRESSRIAQAAGRR